MFSHADLIILGRAALGTVLGFLIGWERHATQAAIKSRTIGLAALTATALTAMGHELFATGSDRIVQGIVTGIGFLGAGVLMHGASGEPHGLTTAASLWAVTGIGVAIGSGHELLGILLAALIYLVAAWGDWPVLAASRLAARRAPDRRAPAASPRETFDVRVVPPGRATSARARAHDPPRTGGAP